MTKRKHHASRRGLPSAICHRERPRFVFGPGLLIALLVAAFLVYRPGRLPLHPPRPGPVVYREVSGTPHSHTPAGPTPEVGWLLERREALGLSASQIRRLEKLKQEWEKATAEDRAAMEQAAKEFQRYMDSRTSSGLRGGRVRPQDLTQQAAAVSELSGRLAAARHDFWERAMKVLTPAQRACVAEARRLGRSGASAPARRVDPERKPL